MSDLYWVELDEDDQSIQDEFGGPQWYDAESHEDAAQIFHSLWSGDDHRLYLRVWTANDPKKVKIVSLTHTTYTALRTTDQ